MALKDQLSKVVKRPEPGQEVYTKWLAEVGLPDYWVINKHGEPMNATDSIRKLLIMLVNEWEDLP